MSVRNTIVDNLIVAVRSFSSSSACSAEIVKIAPYHFNYRTEYASNTPMLMVIDQGNEQRLVEDATHERFVFDVLLVGYTNGPTYEAIQSDLNALLTAIKEFVNSGPSLGDNVLDTQWIEGLAHSIDPEKQIGETGATIRIIYWCLKGTY